MCSQRRTAASYGPGHGGRACLRARDVRGLRAGLRFRRRVQCPDGRVQVVAAVVAVARPPPAPAVSPGEVPVSGVSSIRSAAAPARPAGEAAAVSRSRMIAACRSPGWVRPFCRRQAVCPAGVRQVITVVGVGSSRTALASGMPIPLPLRPSRFCRSRRACQDCRDSVSLKFPAAGVGSRQETGQGGGLPAEDEQPVAAVRRAGVASA
jgi:hypothetical protein